MDAGGEGVGGGVGGDEGAFPIRFGLVEDRLVEGVVVAEVGVATANWTSHTRDSAGVAQSRLCGDGVVCVGEGGEQGAPHSPQAGVDLDEVVTIDVVEVEGRSVLGIRGGFESHLEKGLGDIRVQAESPGEGPEDLVVVQVLTVAGNDAVVCEGIDTGTRTPYW